MHKPTFILIFLNTILLGSLTILHNPLAKIAKNLTDKYRKEQTALVCYEVLAYKEVYAEHARSMFKSGCITTVREKALLDAKTKDQKDNIQKIFKERDSMEFEKVDNYCSGWSAEYEKQGKISNTVMSDLFYTMKCDKLGETNEQAIDFIYKTVRELEKDKKKDE